MRQQRSAPGAAGELNTQKLPAGLYYLVRLDGQNRPVRQTIQVQH